MSQHHFSYKTESIPSADKEQHLWSGCSKNFQISMMKSFKYEKELYEGKRRVKISGYGRRNSRVMT